MRSVLDYIAAHAADLAYSLAFFLICYLIARILKVSPPFALAFAALPMLVLYWMQNPNAPARLVAMLG